MEYCGNKITKSLLRDSVIKKILSGVVNKKVGDHCITILLTLEKVAEYPDTEMRYKVIQGNKEIYNLNEAYNWNSSLKYYHTIAYDKLVEIFQNIYYISARKVKLTKRRL